jgi:hypothetical protein
MADNYIYQFARDAAALTSTDSEYLADAQRIIGNQPGIARADFVNKAMKQSGFMSHVLAQFIVDYAGTDVKDSDEVSVVITNLLAAFQNTTGFAAGTKLVFPQATAPTGWTKDTTNNDMALRVVTGTGGGIGGTHNLSTPPSTAHVHAGASHAHSVAAHSHDLSNHTHTGPSHIHSMAQHAHTGPSHTHTGPSHAHSIAAFTLSISEMPAHFHYLDRAGGVSEGEAREVNQSGYNLIIMVEEQLEQKEQEQLEQREQERRPQME